MIVRSLFALGALVLTPPAPAGSSSQAAPAAPPAEAQPTAPTIYDVEIVARYPHDPGAFTQGLLWHDGALFESTGKFGASTVRKVDLATGAVLMRRAIPPDQFGEGLALWQDDLVSLTWKAGAIHRWRARDLAPIRSDAGYPFQGWGLTRFENHLVASDGSDTLRFLDPEDYSVQRTVAVTINCRPLARLDELELVDGMILANVWMTDFIVGIDPGTGIVQQVINLRNLEGANPPSYDAVLNGIAWDAENRRLFVTGKLWPWLYEVRLVERKSGQ